MAIEAPRREIRNPATGERIVIRQSGDELLAFDLHLPPRGHVPAAHVHPAQEERFTVLAGRMRFRVGSLALLRLAPALVAGPGETVVVPARTAHWFGNAGGVESHALVEVRPALRMEDLLAATGELGAGSGPLGLPRPTELARFLLEFRREIGVPSVPALLVRIAGTPLAWLARRRQTTRT
jgi:mannose-6-phosphate isomerase-like protein (cupin superfamily)